MLIKTVTTQLLQDLPSEVDLFLCACGYESRSTHVASKVARSANERIALGFQTQHELRYEENRKWFVNNGFKVFDADDEEYGAHVAQALRRLSETNGTPKIVVDISCMNRSRLAKLVTALRSCQAHVIDVAFAYNLAAFSAPSEYIAPTSVAEPVTPEFAGRSEEHTSELQSPI